VLSGQTKKCSKVPEYIITKFYTLPKHGLYIEIEH